MNEVYKTLLMSLATLNIIEDIVNRCNSATAADAARADRKAISEIDAVIKQLHEAKE